MSPKDVLNRQVEQLCADRRCEEVVRFLRELSARDPRDPALSYQLGICLSGGCANHSLADPHRAIPWLLAALAANRAGGGEDRARILSALGNTWVRCNRFPVSERTRAAIHCYQEAAELYLAARQFEDWAREEYNLGVARCDLAAEQPALWAEAVEDFRKALLIRTRQRDALHHAATLQNLGTAYRSMIEGDRRANLAAALRCYRTALEIYRREHSVAGTAAVKNNIGNVWLCFAGGASRRERLARYALRHFEQALEFYQQATYPYHHAVTLFNRAQALASLGRDLEAAEAFREAAGQFDNCGQSADALQARNLSEAAAASA